MTNLYLQIISRGQTSKGMNLQVKLTGSTTDLWKVMDLVFKELDLSCKPFSCKTSRAVATNSTTDKESSPLLLSVRNKIKSWKKPQLVRRKMKKELEYLKQITLMLLFNVTTNQPPYDTEPKTSDWSLLRISFRCSWEGVIPRCWSAWMERQQQGK